jgi:hypothetical protein
MKTIFVTVSDDRSGRKGGVYGKTQSKVLEFFSVNNPSFGITDYLFITFDDIQKTEFYQKNKRVLDQIPPDMNGRCYKPYAILEGLSKIDYGDFLIYNDVSPELWKFIDTQPKIKEGYTLDSIKELCTYNGGILTPAICMYMGDPQENYHRHEFYTLDRCMKRMNLEEYKYSLQHAGGMMVLQKTDKSVKCVEEWLHYNLIDECASLGPVEGVTRDFWYEECEVKSGHRHDQSISGLLINKMNNKLIIAPPNTIYPTYNFLSYCIFMGHYYFIDSNQPKTKRAIKTILKEEYEVVLFDR